jgi:hypothetical protein
MALQRRSLADPARIDLVSGELHAPLKTEPVSLRRPARLQCSARPIGGGKLLE